MQGRGDFPAADLCDRFYPNLFSAMCHEILMAETGQKQTVDILWACKLRSMHSVKDQQQMRVFLESRGELALLSLMTFTFQVAQR